MDGEGAAGAGWRWRALVVGLALLSLAGGAAWWAWRGSGRGADHGAGVDAAGEGRGELGGEGQLRLERPAVEGGAAAWQLAAGRGQDGGLEGGWGGQLVAVAMDEVAVGLRRDGEVVVWGDRSRRMGDVPEGLGGVVAVATRRGVAGALCEDGRVQLWGEGELAGQVWGGCVGLRLIEDPEGRVVAVVERLGGVVELRGGEWGEGRAWEVGIAGLADLVLVEGGVWALDPGGELVGLGVEGGDDWQVPEMPEGVGPVVAMRGEGGAAWLMAGGGGLWEWSGDGWAEVEGVGEGFQLHEARGDRVVWRGEGGRWELWGVGEEIGGEILEGAIDVRLGRWHGVALGEVAVGRALSRARQDELGNWAAWAWGGGGRDLGWMAELPAAWRFGPVAQLAAGAPGLRGLDVGGGMLVALHKEGEVRVWGTASQDVPDEAQGAVAVSASHHVLALRHDGRVVAWGRDDHGQCRVPGGLDGIEGVAAVGNSSYAIRGGGGGELVSWGQERPWAPEGLAGVEAVVGGRGHRAALLEGGGVVVWGARGLGQMDVPAAARDLMALASGSFELLALRADGVLVHWGRDLYAGRALLAPPAGLGKVTAVAAWDRMACARRQSDGVWVAWGAGMWEGGREVEAAGRALKLVPGPGFFAAVDVLEPLPQRPEPRALGDGGRALGPADAGVSWGLLDPRTEVERAMYPMLTALRRKMADEVDSLFRPEQEQITKEIHGELVKIYESARAKGDTRLAAAARADVDLMSVGSYPPREVSDARAPEVLVTIREKCRSRLDDLKRRRAALVEGDLAAIRGRLGELAKIYRERGDRANLADVESMAAAVEREFRVEVDL